jgi:hypothetical protein
MIDPDLLSAFLSTKFIICAPHGDIVLRVGERNPKLDDLLATFGAMSCAFVTAWNPGSVRLTDSENAAQQSALITEVRARGHSLLYGSGAGESGAWPPEDSILIIGIGRTAAKEIGALFKQIAIVFAERQQAVELLLCGK